MITRPRSDCLRPASSVECLSLCSREKDKVGCKSEEELQAFSTRPNAGSSGSDVPARLQTRGVPRSRPLEAVRSSFAASWAGSVQGELSGGGLGGVGIQRPWASDVGDGHANNRAQGKSKDVNPCRWRLEVLELLVWAWVSVAATLQHDVHQPSCSSTPRSRQ